jgi:hypothetical protein
MKKETKEPVKSGVSPNSYLKYSGMAFQMGAIIALFSLGGYYLDQYLSTLPLFTLIGSLSSVALSLYLFIRQALNDN